MIKLNSSENEISDIKSTLNLLDVDITILQARVDDLNNRLESTWVFTKCIFASLGLANLVVFLFYLFD